MKRLTNFLHLAAGLGLLWIGAYFFLGIADKWKTWWERPQETASTQTSSDPAASTGTKMVSVLGQLTGESGGANGGDAAPPDSSTAAAGARVYAANMGQPNHLLHRRLSVETYQIFEFQVPPHAIHPRLEGRFSPAGERRSQGNPSIEVLLMNEEGFVRFTSNKQSAPVYSADASSRGEVHWPLVGTSRTQKYYLVFRNSSGRPSAGVNADFTAAFE